MPDKNKVNTSGGMPSGEELDKRIIKYTMAGLIANHWEGGNGWNNFCKSSAGDYPSIGVLGWEGLGGNGDAVLNAVGLGQYAGQSYSALEPHKEEIQAVLDSPAGHQGQLQLLSEMEVGYLGTLRDSGWNSSDPKATTFVMCWMGAGPNCCGPFASRQPTANLDQIYQHFLSGWANAAGVTCVEGYNNRTESTYAYCQTIDFTKDADLDVIIDMAAAAANNRSGLKKGACATDRGFKVRGTVVEKVPDKTFCEPVYPDYITVSDTTPAWALTMEQDLEAAKNEDPTGKIIKNGDAPEKAPNGMNYHEEDIKVRMEANGETREQAIAALSKEPKYNTPVADNGDGTFTVTGKADEKPAENNTPKDGDTKEIAPNGKHYFENDIKYLLDHNKGMTREQAIAVLAQNKKYAKEAET